MYGETVKQSKTSVVIARQYLRTSLQMNTPQPTQKRHFIFLGAAVHKNFKYQELKSINRGVRAHLMAEENVSFAVYMLKTHVYFDEK